MNRRATVGSLATIALAATLATCGEQTVTGPLGAHNRIIFVSDRAGGRMLFSMRSDGADVRQLTTGIQDIFPAVSPDGARIAFTRVDFFGPYLVIVDANGGGETIVPNTLGSVDVCAWSPDGQRLAISVASPGGSRRGIFVIDLEGRNATLITDPIIPASEPSWSPDGAWIVYARGGPMPGLDLVHPDGTGRMALVNDASGPAFPAWSPDGTRIAYVNNPFADAEIWTVNADGTNPSELTRHLAKAYVPTWSPDGARLAFQSNRDGPFHIFSVRARDGSDQRTLAASTANDIMPAWGH